MTKTVNIFKTIGIVILLGIWSYPNLQAHTVFEHFDQAPVAPGPVTLTASDVSTIEGATACVDINVANFTDILHAQWSNTFNPGVASFIEIQNFGLPGLTASNFTLIQGFLSFTWDAPNEIPVTLADNSVVFSICFEAVGNEGEMSNIAFTTIPTNIYITDVNSNTAHIGDVLENGLFSIISPPPPLEITDITITNANCIAPNSGAIDITVAGGTPPYAYQWSNNETTEDIADLVAMGYTISVEDSSIPSLKTSVTYLVGSDSTTPNADAGTAMVIDCNNSTIVLDGTDSDMGATYNYSWTTNDGNILNGGNTLEPEVDEAGTYTLFIVHTLSGCTNMDVVEVSVDTALAPQVDAGMDIAASCVTNLVQLDATNSDQNVEIAWTSPTGNFVTGENTLTPVVDTLGVYILTLTNTTNGCSASDEMEVTESVYPIADAGADIEVGCSEEIATLNGSNSSQGNGFIYSWITENGRITDDENTLTPTIDKLGLYEIIVTNTATGCASQDTMAVILLGNLPTADAGEDRIICDNTSMLSANQPENTIGQWQTTSIAIIENETANETPVVQLIPGTSAFVWTLSSAECLNYSSDTVYITREGMPEAYSDQELLAEGGQVIQIDVIENDNLWGMSDWEVLLISDPPVGTAVNLGDGLISFSIPSGFMGGINFEYALCNLACAELCDTASISIVVEEEIGGGTDNEGERTQKLVNGITPNGDGINDALIFDELLENPTLYPNSELVVFNRWGDIVYKSRPYNNDWEGTNQQGNLLPLSTYYYIFRLSLADGKIIQGDVTIVK